MTSLVGSRVHVSNMIHKFAYVTMCARCRVSLALLNPGVSAMIVGD